MTEYIEPEEFVAFLNADKGERGISDFIANRPQILYWTFCRAGGHCRFVFREFPLGSQYKTDYVILNSYSGVWEVMFIELEPIDDPVFTKAGVPTQRLARAIKQVDDWAEYFDINKDQIRNDIVKWATEKDILGYEDDGIICNDTGDYLVDPSSYLKESYHIVIGRRANLDRASHKRKATYTSKHNIEIVSYDRLKDLVDLRYANPDSWLNKS
jgi:hypothetical protein